MKTPDIAYKFYSGQVSRIWNKNGLKLIARRTNLFINKNVKDIIYNNKINNKWYSEEAEGE